MVVGSVISLSPNTPLPRSMLCARQPRAVLRSQPHHPQQILILKPAPAAYTEGLALICFSAATPQRLSQPAACRHHESLYEVDAANMGNIARFVNHSCDANLFVQPVLGDHHDVMQVQDCP